METSRLMINRPRATMIPIRFDQTKMQGFHLPEGTIGHACCPYCRSKIIVEWKIPSLLSFGWQIKTRCPHMRGEGRGGRAIAFYKNESDVRREENEYTSFFKPDIVAIYRYWYNYPFTQEKCNA